MEMSEKTLKRLQRAKETIETFGKQEVAWKRRLADALLALVRDRQQITQAALIERLEEMGRSTMVIEGTDLKIEISRMASETAIANLQEAAGMMRDEADKQ